MANEFVARKGLIVLENGARISGSISSSVGVTAPYFYGDGSGLTNIVAAGTISSSGQFTNLNDPFTGSFTGSFTGDGSQLTGIATILNIAGTTGTDAVNLKTDILTVNGAAGGISASVTDNTITLLLPLGIVTSSQQIRSGSFTGSFLGDVIGTASWATNAVTSSFALSAPVPAGTVSSSEQIRSGSFTGSFLGNLIGTASWANNALVADYALASALPPGTVSSSEQIRSGSFTGSFLGDLIGTSSWATNAITASYIIPSGLPPGTVSASSQVSIVQTTGYTTFSSSISTVNSAQNLRLDAIEGKTGSYATTGSNIFNGNQIITGSLNVTAGITGSLLGTSSWASRAVTASYALASALPAGTVSSSEQINTGSFTGSFTGQFIGTASWANNVQFTGIANRPTLVSASSQIDVRDTTGIATIATTGSNTFTGIQTISNTTNSTAFNNGALIVAGGVGIAKDVNISGSLTVTGLLTAVSMSTQYVTSSQLVVADNKIIVNVNDLVRFGGLSVIDSGSSSPTTASIYWDSLNHKFIYENLSGSAYNSAMFIAGPVNTAALGNEVGLTVGRVPVASGDDHIDSRPASSSIRVDFPSRLTHIEAGLTITGSLTSSIVTIGGALYDGATTANIIGPNTPTGQVVETISTTGYDGAHFKYVIKDGTNFRTGTVMAVWSGAAVEYTDISTNDIGNTAQASFEVDLNSGNARLKFLVTSGTWTVKVAATAL